MYFQRLSSTSYWYFTERNGMEGNGTYGINHIELAQVFQGK